MDVTHNDWFGSERERERDICFFTDGREIQLYERHIESMWLASG